MNPDYDTMAWLTYTAQRSAGYEEWLRAEDNPFFNSRPGVAHYSNWKIVDLLGTPLPFSHFDFFGVEPQAVEQVWFDGPLDEFRAGWVSKWGYAGGVPSPENQYGYLMRRRGDGHGRRSRFVLVVGSESPQDHPGFSRWTCEARLRKHWAIGPAPAGEPWQLPVRGISDRPFGVEALLVRSVEAPAEWRRELPPYAFALLAECIAAPDR